MQKKDVCVKNKTGLHARPASIFVKLAKTFKSEVFIQKDDKKVNGKSMLGILGMSIGCGDEITIKVNGEDEKKAIKSIYDLFENELMEE
ncbi:MAG: HPr family phosphocarrier protein [Bacillota bacterium]